MNNADKRGFVISIPEAVAMLGVSRHIVLLAIENGHLDTRRYEGKTYIVREDFLDYMERGSDRKGKR